MRLKPLAFALFLLLLLVLAGCLQNASPPAGQNFTGEIDEGGVYNNSFGLGTQCIDAIPGHNNLDQNRINVVFVGTNFSDVNEFISLAEDSVDYDGNNYGVLSVEPFKSNKDKFNFFYVNKIEPFPEFYVGLDSESSQPDISDPSNIPDSEFNQQNMAEASLINPAAGELCIVNNKRVINLVHNYVDRSHAGLGINAVIAVPLQQPPETIYRVVVHEIGHTIGWLSDEYVLGRISTNIGPEVPSVGVNCYTSTFVDCNFSTKENPDTERCAITPKAVADCEANAGWKDLIGNGCGKEGIVDCKPEIVETCIDNVYCTPENVETCNTNCHKTCPADYDAPCFEQCNANCIGRCTEKICTNTPVFDSPEGVLEVSCLNLGCGSINMIRLSYNTIMNNYTLNPFSFGPNNERELCRAIKLATGSVGGVCNSLCMDGCPTGQRCIGGACKIV